MAQFDPAQALTQYIELHDKQAKEVDQRPDLLQRMERGDYNFRVDADYVIHELEREAEQNGFYLEWTFDQEKNDFAYTCRKMTPEEYEEYLEWEKEEE